MTVAWSARLGLCVCATERCTDGGCYSCASERTVQLRVTIVEYPCVGEL